MPRQKSLDKNKTFITDSIIESIDGFLLGDGSISANCDRLTCALEYEEFCRYLMADFNLYNASVNKYNDSHMSQGFSWHGRTLKHPDIKQQFNRWYKQRNGKWLKSVPQDVKITPKSAMMWYLGDGSVVQSGNSISLRLSTDGFTKDEVLFLAEKLNNIGILCHRNNDNRIYVKAKGIPCFFNFIGNKSPVKCYDYKFDLPHWRFDGKRIKEVCEELNINYNRFSHLVKIGKIDCYRASPNGRPRLSIEHIEKVKRLISTGELY